MSQQLQVKRALVSVSDKTGVITLARQLESFGIEIISTGGTLKALRNAGIHVISVSTFTGEPEMLGGRVKTLHPKVHAGIMYRRDNPDDVDQLSEHDYRAIDLVVVNLYPFEKTVTEPSSSEAEIIEKIDIGGPTMIRAGAKNFAAVTVVTDPSEYAELVANLTANGGVTSAEFRRMQAARAFARIAAYDRAIENWFAVGKPADTGEPSEFPVHQTIHLSLHSGLRYGENPHQKAALYRQDDFPGTSLTQAEFLSGKELSYNNYNDLDTALAMALDFAEPFACVLKHTNPCGAAIGLTPAEAYQRAYESDPLSAYGSIIGLNREVDLACAEIVHETTFVECILAPSYTDEALELLKKKKQRRLLALPGIILKRRRDFPTYRHLLGAMLIQEPDLVDIAANQLNVVTKRPPTPAEVADMLFAWKVVKHTKSNAIVLANGGATVGIGMGQTSRVDSAFMAVKRAGERAKGAVLASDAFFPMADGVEVATAAGVTALIQPGGSKRDDDAIAAADAAGAAMVFTGVRHFKH